MGLLDGQTQGSYYQGTNFGDYQFVTLDNIISAFMVAYVGEDKIIPKVNRTDVQFHAMRSIQELTYDVFRSVKSREIEVPNTGVMILPQDYVNYVKLVRVDDNGIERVLYPTGKTSNPFKPQFISPGDHFLDDDGSFINSGEMITNGTFSGGIDGWEGNFSWNTMGQQNSLNNLPGPEYGWQYDDVNKALRVFSGFMSNMVNQGNLQIIPGQQYKLKYTVSNHESGSFKWRVVDEDGDYTDTGTVSGNGTYEQTVTAGNSTSNYLPGRIILMPTDGTVVNTFNIDNVSLVRVGSESSSTTLSSYQDQTAPDPYMDDTNDLMVDYRGRRYGLDPQHAQSNGTFFIDYNTGKIHFGSTLIGKIVTLKYISDGLGTDNEMVVHKFCEDACYKHIAYAILSTRSNIPEYIVQRYRKEKFAATRKAKIRLSNIKIEEFTQVLKGMSKPIK